MIKYFLFIPIFISLYILLINSDDIYSDNNLFFSLDEKPFNKTFSEWANWWWQIHISIPNDGGTFHPRAFYTTEKCNLGQDGGPVWFLPDAKEKSIEKKRTCIVPEGKSVMVQVIGSGCSTGEKGEGYDPKTEEGLRSCADWVFKENDKFTTKYDFQVVFDGIKIMDTKNNPSDKSKFYVNECRTNLTYAFPSIYTVSKGMHPYVKDFTNEIPRYCDPDSSGIFNAVVSGYYFLSKPLKSGNHTLDVEYELEPEFRFGERTKEQRPETIYGYNLIVK